MTAAGVVPPRERDDLISGVGVQGDVALSFHCDEVDMAVAPVEQGDNNRGSATGQQRVESLTPQCDSQRGDWWEARNSEEA